MSNINIHVRALPNTFSVILIRAKSKTERSKFRDLIRIELLIAKARFCKLYNFAEEYIFSSQDFLCFLILCFVSLQNIVEHSSPQIPVF